MKGFEIGLLSLLLAVSASAQVQKDPTPTVPQQTAKTPSVPPTQAPMPSEDPKTVPTQTPMPSDDPKIVGAKKGGVQEPGVVSEDFCTLMPDGDYELPEAPCSSSFISCTVGSRVEKQCAAPSLRFDPISGLCLLPEHVVVCGGTATTTEEPEKSKKPAEPLPDTGVDCTGREDGDYPSEMEACSRVYASCVAESITTRVCAGELHFDSISGMCLEMEWVEACGGTATTTVEPEEIKQKPGVPGVTCETDGNFPHPGGCNGMFVSCTGGVAEERECFKGLDFDVATDMCLPAEFVERCGGVATTTEEIQIIQKEPVDFDCSDKLDGNYALMRAADEQKDQGHMMPACSEVFVSCVGGEAHKRTCAEGHKYDIDTDMCLEEMFVAACGGTPTTTIEPELNPQQRILFGVDCQSRPDGIFANIDEPCSRMFVQCTGGFAHPAQCATETTRYDIISNSCLEPEWVDACGGVVTTRMPEKPFEPLPVPDFDCSTLPDGHYAMMESGKDTAACTREFISCVAGVAIQRQCPTVLRFDAISSRCIEVDYVVACGGEATEAPKVPEPMPMPDLENVCDPENDELKADNREGMQCSKWFTACVGGAPITMVCPANSRFDIERSECRHAAFITACGGTPETETPSEPQQVQTVQKQN